MLALADRLPEILDMLDQLPQTYAHGDASPQNLLLPAREPGTVIVIDWGFGSLLPIGFDLGQLLVGLAHAGEVRSRPACGTSTRRSSRPTRRAWQDRGLPGSPGARPRGLHRGPRRPSALSALPLELLSRPRAEEAGAEFLSRLRLTRALIDFAAEITAAEPEPATRDRSPAPAAGLRK